MSRFLDYRERVHALALAEVNALIDSDARFSLDPVQPEIVDRQRRGGGTNFVLWGRYESERVVFKYFHPDWGTGRYRNELGCLRHFAPTGWMPELFATRP